MELPTLSEGSPRYWNVERHIWRLDGGLGEPVNEFGVLRKQCQIEMNLQYGHGYQNKDPQLAPLSHNQVKDFRASATDNYGMDNSNNNSKRWDFIDEAIEPVKKLLEFNRARTALNLKPAILLSFSFSNCLWISIASVDPYESQIYEHW